MTEAGPIGDSGPRSVLIVAHRTAATPALLAAVSRRASEGACRFTLLVPRAFWDADTEESAVTLELAIPLLEEAAGGRVEGLMAARTRSRRSPRPSEPAGTTRSSSPRSRHTSPTGCTSTSPRVSGGSVCPSRSSPREKRAGPSGPPAEPGGRRGPAPGRRETRRRRPHPPSATAATAQLIACAPSPRGSTRRHGRRRRRSACDSRSLQGVANSTPRASPFTRSVRPSSRRLLEEPAHASSSRSLTAWPLRRGSRFPRVLRACPGRAAHARSGRGAGVSRSAAVAPAIRAKRNSRASTPDWRLQAKRRSPTGVA